jgi:hypothetical protein
VRNSLGAARGGVLRHLETKKEYEGFTLKNVRDVFMHGGVVCKIV